MEREVTKARFITRAKELYRKGEVAKADKLVARWEAMEVADHMRGR